MEGAEIWHGLDDHEVDIKQAQHNKLLMLKDTLLCIEGVGHELATLSTVQALLGNLASAGTNTQAPAAEMDREEGAEPNP